MKNSTYGRRSQTVSTVKQVAGDHPCDLLAQKRPPGAVGSPWCRVEPAAAECGADRGRRDAHAEALEFSLDALVVLERVEADNRLYATNVAGDFAVSRSGEFATELRRR
jgi:hypothetical protein